MREFGSGSEFGFENPLPLFGLLPPAPETDPPQVRHTLGFGHLDPQSQKNPLPFLNLLPRFDCLRVSHNRQVEDGRPLPFKSFWAHHFL